MDRRSYLWRRRTLGIFLGSHQIIEQLKALRAALEKFNDAADWTAYNKAITALSELERMAGEPVAWQSIESMAAQRYRVVPSHESMFYRHAVVAGDGTQQLYHGREVECENMARKFAGAFLDGAYAAQNYAAPVAQQDEHLTITWDEQQTRILAVTMQDEEGRILKVLAEAPALQPQYEAGDMASAHNDGFRAGVASVAQQPQAEAVPTIYVSKGQLDNLKPDPEDTSGTYLPVRKSPKGTFTHPLFAAPKQAEPFSHATQLQIAYIKGLGDGALRPAFQDEWTGYLKDGETPFERFMRERRDLTSLTKLYQRSLEENERLKAQQPQAECRSDGRCQYAIDHGAEGLGHCPEGKCAMKQPRAEVAEVFYCKTCGTAMQMPHDDCLACERGAPQQAEAVPPPNCRQRLAREGKLHPRSSCAVCGPLSPKWQNCNLALALEGAKK